GRTRPEHAGGAVRRLLISCAAACHLGFSMTSMNSSRGNGWLLGMYAATVFVSAFLLFQVQPLISRTILPWFGGSPAVWTTCMLFFQSALFLGYAYAHTAERKLAPRWQALAHFAL